MRIFHSCHHHHTEDNNIAASPSSTAFAKTFAKYVEEEEQNMNRTITESLPTAGSSRSTATSIHLPNTANAAQKFAGGTDTAALDYPEEFLCPISMIVMAHPVVDREGNTYERSAIETWLTNNSTSPITRRPLRRSDLAPNRALASLIERAMNKKKKAASKKKAKLLVSQVEEEVKSQSQKAKAKKTIKKETSKVPSSWEEKVIESHCYSERTQRIFSCCDQKIFGCWKIQMAVHQRCFEKRCR